MNKRSSFFDDPLASKPKPPAAPLPTPINLGYVPPRETVEQAARSALMQTKQIFPRAYVPEGITPVKSVETPSDFHMVQTKSGQRVLIVNTLSSDYSELHCHSFSMNATIHMKRVDLVPKETVDRAIELLAQIRSFEKER